MEARSPKSQAPVPLEVRLPEPRRRNLLRAVEILRKRGCTEVYLFGSTARGEA